MDACSLSGAAEAQAGVPSQHAGGGAGPVAVAVDAAGSSSCSSAACSDAPAEAQPRFRLHIDACDPYTYAAFEARTGRTALRWSFEDIAEGCLEDESNEGAGRRYELCICSFAMHLCNPGLLFMLLWQLARHCHWLVVLSPHKQPHIKQVRDAARGPLEV